MDPLSAGVPPTILVTAVTALLSAVLGAFFTNMFAGRRATREKLWDLRRIAYSQIIAETQFAEWILDNAAEYIAEDSYRYFEGPVSRDHNKAISTHLQAARSTYEQNYLILSESFVALYEQFSREVEHDPNGDFDPDDRHAIFDKALRKLRQRLVVQARRELPFKDPLLRRVWHKMRWRHHP